MAPSQSKQPKDTKDVKKKPKESVKPKEKDVKDTAEGKKATRESVLKGIQKSASPNSTTSTAASSAEGPSRRRVSFKQPPVIWTPENRTKSVVSPEAAGLARAKSSAHLGENVAKANEKKEEKVEKKGVKEEKKKDSKDEKKDKKEKKEKKEKKAKETEEAKPYFEPTQEMCCVKFAHVCQAQKCQADFMTFVLAGTFYRRSFWPIP